MSSTEIAPARKPRLLTRLLDSSYENPHILRRVNLGLGVFNLTLACTISAVPLLGGAVGVALILCVLLLPSDKARAALKEGDSNE